MTSKRQFIIITKKSNGAWEKLVTIFTFGLSWKKLVFCVWEEYAYRREYHDLLPHKKNLNPVFSHYCRQDGMSKSSHATVSLRITKFAGETQCTQRGRMIIVYSSDFIFACYVQKYRQIHQYLWKNLSTIHRFSTFYVLCRSECTFCGINIDICRHIQYIPWLIQCLPCCVAFCSSQTAA